MSERNTILLIEDMIEAASRIIQYTEKITFDEFEQNQLVKDAVLRNFEVIGEAANRLPRILNRNGRRLTGPDYAVSEIGSYITISVSTIPLFGKLKRNF